MTCRVGSCVVCELVDELVDVQREEVQAQLVVPLAYRVGRLTWFLLGAVIATVLGLVGLFSMGVAHADVAVGGPTPDGGGNYVRCQVDKNTNNNLGTFVCAYGLDAAGGAPSTVELQIDGVWRTIAVTPTAGYVSGNIGDLGVALTGARATYPGGLKPGSY